MACTITLNIGAERIELSVPSPNSLPSTLEEMLNLLYKKGKLKTVQETIISKLKKGFRTEKSSQKDYLNRTEFDKDGKEKEVRAYGIPNMNGEDLKMLFPDISFPPNLSKYRIQLVGEYKPINNEVPYGITKDSKGQEIILIDGNKRHLIALSNYFSLRDKLESDMGGKDIISEIMDSDSEDKFLIEGIMKSANPSDTNIRDLIIKFANNRKLFRSGNKKGYKPKNSTVTVKYISSSGEENILEMSFFRAMDLLCTHLVDGYKSARTFKNPVINSLNDALLYKSYDVGSISKKDFISIVINNGLIKKSLNEKEVLENLSSSNSLFRWSLETIKKLFFNKDGKLKDTKAFIEFFNKDINDNFDNLVILFPEHLKIKESLYINPEFDPELEVSDTNKKYKGSGWDVLFNALQDKEPEFARKISKNEKGNLEFTAFFPTLKSAYGYGFEDVINLSEPIYYKGSYIQEINGKWFVLDNYTTEELFAVMKDTKWEALNYITERNQIISKNAFYELNQREIKDDGTFFSDDNNNLWVQLPKFVRPGTILTTLDYNIPNNTKDIKGTLWENFLIGDDSMSDFADFLRSPTNILKLNLDSRDLENIIRQLNSPIKVALFVSQLFNPKLIKFKDSKKYTGLDFKNHKRESIKKVKLIVKDIEGAKLKYYYVHLINKTNIAYIVPIQNDRIEDTLKEYRGGNRNYPITSVWEATVKYLNEEKGINIPMKLITQLDIIDYNEGKDPSQQINENAKAFISSYLDLTAIYLNVSKARSTDLFHEYTHLFLGMLKLVNPESYQQLLTKVWEGFKVEVTKGKRELSKSHKAVLKNYENYPMETIMEEFFVNKFVRIVLQGKGNLLNFLNEDLENLYNLFIPDKKGPKLDLKVIGKMTVYDVLLSFNASVANNLNVKSKTLFGRKIENSLNSLLADRRKVNWIKNLIKNGNLKEEC